ncbi:MAG: M16 family metallopeptidase [Candidatus Promineifilaceae bacterium]
MPNKSYPGPESINRYRLANGITVLIYENEASQSVVVDGLLRAGALADSKELSGLANYAASMLLRGTRKRSFDEVFEEIESIGASVDISAGRHDTDFVGHCLVEDLQRVLDILSDAIRQPTFPTDQVERIRGEIAAGLQIRANDTRQMAGLKFRELLYEDHPYGRSVEGYLETIQNIDQDALVQYHERYFGPEGMIITIAGGISSVDALALVETAFGDWKKEQLPMAPASSINRPDETRRTHFEMPAKTQTDIVLGVPGPLRAAPDYLEASMANTILGVFGMYGRLGLNVREAQGLAYYSYSQLRGGLGPSPWYVSTGVAPDKVEVAIESILHEIERIIQEPIPEDELADSQAFRSGTLPVSLETNQGVATVLTDMELFELGLDYLQMLPDRINAMTPESVQSAAGKYLSVDELAIASAGP